MKLIKPSAEIIEQKPGLEGIYEMIEMAGRTCYKSERKEGTTAKDFVDRMIASGHGAMLEHGTVYLHQHFDDGYRRVTGESYQHYIYNPYSKVNCGMKVDGSSDYYITTNYRVLVENDWLDDLQYLCDPTKHHEKRHTVKFITDIGVGRELLRHRVQQEDYEPEPMFSYANESTRYCNYSKDKFGNELTFIAPQWYSWDELNDSKDRELVVQLYQTEQSYLDLIKQGCKPEEARVVLPLATKSELVMTGFESDWSKVFDLRVKGTTGKPHPDCKALVEPVMNEFIKRNWYGNN